MSALVVIISLIAKSHVLSKNKDIEIVCFRMVVVRFRAPNPDI